MLIKQPNGKYANYSGGTDSLTYWDATPEEVIEITTKRAVEQAKRAAEHSMALADEFGADSPFSMSWAEARAQHLRTYPEDAWGMPPES